MPNKSILRFLTVFVLISLVTPCWADWESGDVPSDPTDKAEMEAVSNSRPNVVLIVADDLGYGDTSCYGATMIKTPNIDRLAAQGMKFIDAHAAASLCSPSRYGLLTGRSPWRLHKKGNGYRVKAGQATLGSVFQSQGYKSAAIGKWHLGYSSNWNKLPITGPLEVGFDYHFGVPQNHNDSTRAFIENHDIVGRVPGEDYRIVDGQDFPDGLAEPRVEDQVDTTLTNKVVQFIRDNAQNPFFVYFTPCASHTHVTPAVEFRGTSRAGLLGDYVQELDSHVEKIVETLEDLNLTENTLLIFTSDNGGSPKDFKGTNKMHLNLADDSGDIRVKFKTAKEDARKMGHMTNGQWHDGKGHPHEGGHRIPFIARWPNKIAPGVVSDTTFCLTDIMATAAQLLNVDIPDGAGEDSISLLPELLGESPSDVADRIIFVQGDGKDIAIAVCAGRWKMIASRNDEGDAYSNELFDLEADPGETNDIAKGNPEIVQRLSKALQKAEANGRTRPL